METADLLPSLSRSKALREERHSLTIDGPLAIADLCSETWVKTATVSQGTVHESLAHPKEIFKPVITHSAYSFTWCTIIHRLTTIPANHTCRLFASSADKHQRCDNLDFGLS